MAKDERGAVYDDRRMAEAWRAFVTEGVIDEGAVRPEIARSWRRCRAAGVNPWSTTFPSMDERLLERKRKQFAHSLEANQPVMRMLLALLQCNVSLQDQENFVFEFFSPLSYYPRTFGTYLREEEVGTGNATLVAYERKPVRVEGFEQYRAVSQGYSGVSAPFLDVDGNYFGALNLNSPFETLPACALDMCKMGVAMANELFLMHRDMWARLRSLEYFRPLVELMEAPVLIVDVYGHILLANGAMEPYVEGYGDFPYGEQSLDAYLGKQSKAKSVLADPFKDGRPLPVSFQAPGKRSVRRLDCLHRNTVQFRNGMRFIVLVFASEDGGGEAAERRAPSARVVADSRKPVDYIGESEEWLRVDAVVDRIAPINANVLLLGETGTGKEMVARAIHRRSGREGNFVAINCGAIPRDLFAAELFGYESGAFTGAKEEGSLGKIEAANHGTLLLDEIGEMPLDLQVGLLRVIQEQAVTRLGSTESRELDVRFLAATNQNLQTLIDARSFRSDLYYRLATIEIELPPLRVRSGDIPLLVDHFNLETSKMLRLPYSPFGADALEALAHYSWPGNVRELRNVVERALILAGEGGKVGADDLPAHIVNARSLGSKFVPATPASLPVAHALDDPRGASVPGVPTAADDDRQIIADLLRAHDGNLSKVAAAMGISRTTLYKRMEKYHMRVRVVVETD